MGFADVTVVAPDRDRSGASNSLTLLHPLRAERAANGFFYVDGTPTATEAQFRAYDSCGQCFHDYAALLARNPRYSAALGTGNDVGAFAAALQRGGYATDPNYARKLSAVADTVSRVLGAEPLKLAAATPIATGSSTL